MMYDLAKEPPEPGSLLESVFLMISLRRREAELFQAEAIIAAIVGARAQKYEAVEESLRAFKNAMFPFLEGAKNRKEDLAKKALEQWTSHGALKVRPLAMLGDNSNRKLHSQLRRSAERTKKAEEARKASKHTRI